jgi:hypothetical protein
MANNYSPQPNESLRAEAEKSIAELNSQLSILDSIATSAVSQKAQLRTSARETENEMSAARPPEPKQVARAKANPDEKIEGGEPAEKLPVTRLEILNTPEPVKKEHTKTGTDSRLVDLDILLAGAQHATERLRVAIAEADPHNGGQYHRRTDLGLPELEFDETLKKQHRTPQ